MAFIQIIDFRTSKIDEGRKLVEEYRAKTAGTRTAEKAIICKDRDQADRYLNIVFFDSYEAAMQNSQMPETNELAQQLGKLTDGEPTFLNLDVIEEQL